MSELVTRESAAPFVLSYMSISGGRSTNFGVLGGSGPKGYAPRPQEALHCHASYEIVYVLEGEFVQHLENGVFRYQAGDACFLNRNVKHREGHESGCTLVFLNLGQEFLEGLYAPSPLRADRVQYRPGEIKRFIEENRSDGGWLRREYLDFAGTASLKQNGQPPAASLLLDMMARELAMEETGYAFRVQALLLRFFQELEDPMSYHLSRIRIDSNSEDFIFARLLRYLEEHKGRASREELSRLLHYNGDYLNRIVKRQLGITVSQLGQQICMREAGRMLSETGMSVSEIVTTLGFANRTHFYRMFARQFGMTPLEYRQRRESIPGRQRRRDAPGP